MSQPQLQLLVEYPADSDGDGLTKPDGDAKHVHPRVRTTRFRVIECARDTKETETDSAPAVIGSSCSWIMIARILLAHAMAFYCAHTFAHFTSLGALLSFPSLLWPHVPCWLAMLLAWRLFGLRSRRSVAGMQQLREESILVIPGVGVQLESGTAAFDPAAAAAIDATIDESNGHRSLSSGVRSTLVASSSASSSSYPSLHRRVRGFLDAARIAHVLIHEGVHRSTFVYYLLIVLKAVDDAATTVEPGAAKRNDSAAAAVAASSASASLVAAADLIDARQTLVLPFEHLQPRYHILLPVYEGMQACLQLAAATDATAN